MRLIVGMISASCGLLNAGSLLDFSYGTLESLNGNDLRANEYFQSAYATDPTAMPLVRIIVGMKMESGDKLGAIGIYEKVISERPESMEARIEFGDFLGTIGRGDALADRKRVAAYRAVLEAMPGQVLPIERLIRFSREKGDDDGARAWLEKLDMDSQEAVSFYVTSTKSLYDSEDEAAQKRIANSFQKSDGRASGMGRNCQSGERAFP